MAKVPGAGLEESSRPNAIATSTVGDSECSVDSRDPRCKSSPIVSSKNKPLKEPQLPFGSPPKHSVGPNMKEKQVSANPKTENKQTNKVTPLEKIRKADRKKTNPNRSRQPPSTPAPSSADSEDDSLITGEQRQPAGLLLVVSARPGRGPAVDQQVITE